MAQRRQAQLGGRGRMLARLLLDPCRDVKRLHGGDRTYLVVLAPGQKLCDRMAVSPPRVRVADIRREEFQEAGRAGLFNALNCSST